MNKLEKLLQTVKPGDNVEVVWTDASVGKSLGSGLDVDVPVYSWGIFVAILGQKNKHIVLAQNSFHYADGVYDVDYTAIPLGWTANIRIIQPNCVGCKAAEHLVNSFVMGGRKTSMAERKIFQRSLRLHSWANG
jgi:hypothetical protein